MQRIEIHTYLTSGLAEDEVHNILAQDVGGARDALTRLKSPTHVSGRSDRCEISGTDHSVTPCGRRAGSVRSSSVGEDLFCDRGQTCCDERWRLFLWCECMQADRGEAPHEVRASSQLCSLSCSRNLSAMSYTRIARNTRERLETVSSFTGAR